MAKRAEKHQRVDINIKAGQIGIRGRPGPRGYEGPKGTLAGQSPLSQSRQSVAVSAATTRHSSLPKAAADKPEAPAGFPGERGRRGYRGRRGPTGPMGPRGIKGIKGEDGDPGSHGT